MALQGIRFRLDTTPDTDSTSELASAVNDSTTTIPVDDGTDFVVGENIKIQSEEMHVSAIDGNNLTVVRAVNSTSAAAHSSTSLDVFEDDSATYTPSRMPDMDVVETTSYKGILQNQAYGGKIYTNEKFGKQLEFELNYTNLSSSDRTKIEALFNAVKGQKETFQFSPDNGSTFHTVRFTKPDLKFTQTTYNIFSIGIVLRQEIS